MNALIGDVLAEKSSERFWTDHDGIVWPVVKSKRRLKFKYPLHAALRVFVFSRDNFQCVHCGAKAIASTEGYSGHETLHTDTFVSSGYRDVLIVDHIVTLKAGGLNEISNFQTLCETCNKHKIRYDNIAAANYRGGAHGSR